MLIGQISHLSQLSRDTIRFYEKKGLIQVEHSTSEFNNYKNYSDENLEQLILIKKAKNFGFTLNEISEILHLFKMKQANCSTMKEKITNKIEDIDRKIQELKEMKELILSQAKSLSGACNASNEKSNCSVFN